MLGVQSQVIKQLPILQAPQLSSSGLHGKETTYTFVHMQISRDIWVCFDWHMHMTVYWSFYILLLNKHDLNL